jgi:hypothetical protein
MAIPMQRRGRFAGAVALLALLQAGWTSAHETWLLPERFTAPASGAARFTMTSGMGFPEPGSAITAERITQAQFVQGGTAQALQPGAATAGVLHLTATSEGGTACAWVNLRPRILQIDSEQSVEHYLEEIGAPESVWSVWRDTRALGAWRESYSKLARSYLAGSGPEAGTAGAGEASCWRTPSTARFDILPLTDPTQLRAGDNLELQLLFDGEPLAGQAVGLVREGAAVQGLLRSDARGRVSITADAAGRHMLYATHLRPVEAEGHAWESDFVTLTFRVDAD